MILKVKMSDHAINDRDNRLTECLRLIGFDHIILTAPDRVPNSGKIRCLTDTGLIFIMTTNQQVLITGYMATIDQAISIFRHNGFEKMPNSLYNRVLKQCKKYPYLLKMKE